MDNELPDKKESGHKHIFDALREIVVLLHDESSKLGDETSRGGRMTGKDILKQRVCKCGAVQTYDLVRDNLGEM